MRNLPFPFVHRLGELGEGMSEYDVFVVGWLVIPPLEIGPLPNLPARVE